MNELGSFFRLVMPPGEDGLPPRYAALSDCRVAVEKTVGDKTMKLAELGAGAVFGEMSLIDNFPTSAGVTLGVQRLGPMTGIPFTPSPADGWG